MEIKIILSPEEQAILGVDEAEHGEEEALPLLFDATDVLGSLTDRINELRTGPLNAQRGELNRAWNQYSMLSGLINGLKRVVGVDQASDTI